MGRGCWVGTGVGKRIAGESLTRLGLILSELDTDQKHEMKVSGGLLVEEVKSAATQADLSRGDIILALGNIELRTLEQFNEALKQVPNGKSVALLVRRNEVVTYVAIRLDEK